LEIERATNSGGLHALLVCSTNVVRENEVLERDFDLDPLIVGERWPDVMRLRHGRGRRLEDHLGALAVHVKGAKDQNQTREGSVGRDRLEPVVVEIEDALSTQRRKQESEKM